MAVYLIGEIEVTDPVGLEPYRTAVNDTIAKYGGRFLVRTSAVGSKKLLEGGPEPKTIVVVEFPDAAAFDLWSRPAFHR